MEEEDIASSLAEYRTLLEEGTQQLESLEFAGSIEAFTRLIEAYKSGQIPMVTSAARDLVALAWERRALALANLGRNDEASADYEALIQFEPTHSIDLEGVSPKIVSLFTTAKKALVGTLRIETDPLGAEVLLDGLSIGPSPVTDREVLAGPHTLGIEREGFDPVEEEIEVEPGAPLERSVRLVPNARGIRVATLPREVKVLVDGVEKGATFGRAGPEYEAVAAEMGIPISDISEPLLVPNLAPGSHVMTLRRDCYEEMTVNLSVEVNPESNDPVAFKPFVLEPSRGALEIVSEPPGAQVFFDGSLEGKAPLVLEDLCSGPHDLVLESEGLGRWTGTAEVRKEQKVTLSRRLRLTLAAFDLRSDVAGPDGLGAALSGLERYNVLSAGSGLPEETIQRVGLEMESTQGRGLSAATIQELLGSLKAELIVVARAAGALGDRTEVQLYGPLHDTPDRWMPEGSGGAIFRPLVAALDRELPVRMAWSGIKLIDVRDESHPVILAVTPGSPAAVAGVKAGEQLVSLSGSPISVAADFSAALSKFSPGAAAKLTIEGDEGSRSLELVLRESPVLLPVKEPSILYNKAIADLRQAAALAGEDRVSAGHAWLNLGIALMHFGHWDLAIREGFRKATLPDAGGISLGTVRYLTGLCYENLGLKQEARSAFEQAAASPAATWGTHDGPTIAPSARRRAEALPGAS